MIRVGIGLKPETKCFYSPPQLCGSPYHSASASKILMSSNRMQISDRPTVGMADAERNGKNQP
jgi:hypothetical protein